MCWWQAWGPITFIPLNVISSILLLLAWTPTVNLIQALCLLCFSSPVKDSRMSLRAIADHNHHHAHHCCRCRHHSHYHCVHLYYHHHLIEAAVGIAVGMRVWHVKEEGSPSRRLQCVRFGYRTHWETQIYNLCLFRTSKLLWESGALTWVELYNKVSQVILAFDARVQFEITCIDVQGQQTSLVRNATGGE